MFCLFCNEPEKNYKPDSGIEFICGKCVQSFLMADQDALKRAHAKAIELVCPRKAKAIESFLKEEETYGKTKRPKPNLARKRAVRKIRPTRNQSRKKPTT